MSETLAGKAASFEDYSRRVKFMVDSGAIEDYTYLWYDVRPHPNFGTVEIRALDGQTRLEHTVGLAAMIQAMVKELCEHFDSGEELSRYPYEMLDENKFLAARHGLDGEMTSASRSSGSPGVCSTACASTHRTWAARTTSMGSPTC